MPLKPRIAVVSPFLDKRHGTERCIIEQIVRLARDYEIHIYSSRVEDIDLDTVVWHKVPALPGPHLFAYCWWFVANHLWRWRDRRFRGLTPDLIYTPGINCRDAGVISVHVVFSEFAEHTWEEMRLGKASLRSWPVLIHRRIYYRLIRALENRIYRQEKSRIMCVSGQVANQIQRHYQRERGVQVIHNAVDTGTFNPEARQARRKEARQELGLSDQTLTLLLIGNDWRSKGLRTLLDALANVRELSLKLLVVGRDERAPWVSLIRERAMEPMVDFVGPTADTMKFYAACDLYVGPSFHDSFALPPLEAMACGLPVITSSRNGGCEVILDGVDGFVLDDPEDSRRLAELVRRLNQEPSLRQQVGQAAAATARLCTWDRNTAELRAVFEQLLTRRSSHQLLETPAVH